MTSTDPTGGPGRPRGLRRTADAVMSALVRRGLGPRGTVLLTAPGRVSGQPRTTPVTLVEHDGHRWLVAPYGPVGWVRNVRAAGVVRVRRGRVDERLVASEVDGEVGAPVLRQYLREVALVRRLFDVEPDDAVEKFVPLVRDHPVFRLDPL